MSSKRRVRRAQCGAKQRYDSESDAQAAMERLLDGVQARMNVYRCAFCGRWHLGHLTSHPHGAARGQIKAARQRGKFPRYLTYRAY